MEPFQFRGNSDRGKGPRHPPRRGNRSSRENFTFRHPHTSERPLLSFSREKTPEQLAPKDDSKPAFKFIIGPSGDNKEHPVEIFDSDDDSRPRKKRTMGGHDGTMDIEKVTLPPPVPTTKWSNPDPYTVLPPVEPRKRPDVIAMIREARNPDAAGKSKAPDAVTKNEDFISLEIPQNKPPANAPSAPKGMKRSRDDEPKGFSTKFGKSLDPYPFPAKDLPPWQSIPSETFPPSIQLHNEIIEFWHWIRPERHEEIVRADLVKRLESKLQSFYNGSKLREFGSFASGVYLPTADMDLVLLSKEWQNFARSPFETPKSIYIVSSILKKSQFAVSGSIETIAHARVPIIKFVDKLTGLRIDLSFDNESGLKANDTFEDWRKDYPAMPMILAVLKQFLLLRGLNEVPTGGIGGFAITCLVTSLLQHMAEPDRHNLGNVLLHFFSFYGDIFDYVYTGIKMEPPEFFPKTKNAGKTRLMIIDPNKRDNDISGGSSEMPKIMSIFSEAFRNITRNMHAATETRETNSSFLRDILAGNFEAYREQRDRLQHVYETSPQFSNHRNNWNSSRRRSRSPPPPPPPEDVSHPLPPPPPTTQS